MLNRESFTRPSWAYEQSAYKRSGWCFQLAQANPRGRTDLHQHMTPQRVEKDLANSVKYELDLLKLQRPIKVKPFFLQL